MDINGLFGSSKTNTATRTAANQPAGGASPSMAGDQLQLSNKKTVVDEVKAMTPEDASKAISHGGYAITAGIIGVGAAYWGAALLEGLAGTMFAPVALGVGAVALGLWGAMKVGQGLSAKLNQATEKAFKLPE